ncbi:MAG: hypothetical protein ACYC8T_01030 [Myxococcaceae bacterium]
MKSVPAEPRKILEALLQPGASVPTEAAPGEVEKARGLVASVSTAPAADVEALPEPLALAVLEAAVRARDPQLAEALAGSAHKALAKAAKRALYQLRSAGLALPEKPPAPAAPPSAPAEAAPELPCLLTPVTGTGEQALLLVRPLRGGGLENFQVVFTDEAGIVSLDRAETNRGDYRKMLREFRGHPGAPREIGRERAREILAAAAAANLSSRNPFPVGVDDALRAFEVKPAEPAPLPPPEPEDERLAVRGHTLHEEPEIASWLPPEPELRVLAGRIDEVSSSPLALSEAQKSEQVVQKVLATAHEFFTPAMKRLYARRLWRMASYFEGTARPGPAGIARAEARLLFHDAPAPSRFAEYLFEKVLVLTERARAGKELPKPGERLEPAAPAEKKTPGGLIIP